MFDEYKQIKIMKRGGKSLQVTLLENNRNHKIVKKQYNKNIPTHRVSFRKEIRILTGLKQYPYTPKLLHIDYDNYTFYETYCGIVVPRNYPNYDQKIIERTKDLYKKYGLAYIKDGEQTWMVHGGNYCLYDDEIYMIDFGSIKWTGSFADEPKEINERKHKKRNRENYSENKRNEEVYREIQEIAKRTKRIDVKINQGIKENKYETTNKPKPSREQETKIYSKDRSNVKIIKRGLKFTKIY